MKLIERLTEANQHLIGAKEHHDAIQEAIQFLDRNRDALALAHTLMQAARPLVLNMLKAQDAFHEINT